MSTPVDKTLRLDRTQLGQKRPSGRPPTLLIAVVAGIVAAVVVGLLLLPLIKRTPTADTSVAQLPATPTAPTKVSVLVATDDINPRTTIKDSMIKVEDEDPSKAPQNAISDPTVAIGMVTINFISKGSPITTDLLNGKGLSNGLAYGITPPMRAITIALDPVSSVAGFLKPRDHVDVIGTFTDGSDTITKTVLQNVLLLATGAQLLPNQAAAQVNTGNGNSANDNAPAAPTGTVAAPTEIPNATVEVTPEDAQKLILAADKGKLQLALRYADDNTIVPIPVTHGSSVTGIVVTEGGQVTLHPTQPIPTPGPGSVAPIPILPSITVIKGTDVRSVTVGQ